MQKTILRGNEIYLGKKDGIQTVEADPESNHSATPAIFGNILFPVESGEAYESNTASHQRDVDDTLPYIDSETEAASCDGKEDCYGVTEYEGNEVLLHLVSIPWGISVYFQL